LWTFFTSVLFLSIGVLAELFFGSFQPFAPGYRFAGSLHPNGQGIQCGLLLLSAVAAADAEKRWRVLFWTCGFLGLVFLILSGSRTALAATLITLLFYLVAVRSRDFKIGMISCLGIVLCLLPVVFETELIPGLENGILHRGDDPRDLSSFNGRSELWKDVGFYIRQRPIFGYGYGGFWTPAHVSVISAEENWPVPNGHSAYIDNLLNLGTVGLVTYTLVLFAGIWRIVCFHKLTRDPVFAFCGALLVFCAVDGLLESALVEGSLLMFLWMVVLAQLAFVPPHEAYLHLTGAWKARGGSRKIKVF
jgi:O-antigen ligase